MRRIKRRSDRPLLRTPDPAATLQGLMDERYPVYALADVTIESRDVSHEVIVDETIEAVLGLFWNSGRARRCAVMTAPLRNNEPITVEVALAGRAYDIVIGRGLLASLGKRVAALRPGARAAIVTDETVAQHHLQAAEASLNEAGITHQPCSGRGGEASKSYPVFERVCEELIAARIERSDLVVALGGGVIGEHN